MYRCLPCSLSFEREFTHSSLKTHVAHDLQQPTQRTICNNPRNAPGNTSLHVTSNSHVFADHSTTSSITFSLALLRHVDCPVSRVTLRAKLGYMHAVAFLPVSFSLIATIVRALPAQRTTLCMMMMMHDDDV